jgi:hypothetical protein
MPTQKEIIEQFKKGISQKDVVAEFQKDQKQQPDRNPLHSDMAIGQGLVRDALLGTLGVPGDLQQWIESLPAKTPQGQWIKDTSAALRKYLPNEGRLPTSEEVKANTIDRIITPKNYEGIPGYAERAASFYTPGPGGKARAARDVISAIGGGVGSKGLEDINEAMGGVLPEGWDRMLGGILGVLGVNTHSTRAGKIATEGSKRPELVNPTGAVTDYVDPRAQMREELKAAPTPKKLEDRTRAAYRVVDRTGGLDKPQFSKAMVDLEDALAKTEVLPSDAPGILEIADQTIDKVLSPNPLTLGDVERLAKRGALEARSNAGNLAGKPLFGHITAKHMNRYLDAADAANPSLGIKQKVGTARELGRSKRFSEDIADVRLGGKFSQMSPEIGEMNRTRAELVRKADSLSELENLAGERAVGRRTAKMPIRNVGRLFQSGPMQGVALLSSGVLQKITPLIASVATSFGGAGLEAIADWLTRARLDELEGVLRAGRPAQEKAMEIAAKRNKARLQSRMATGVLGALRNPGQE